MRDAATHAAIDASGLPRATGLSGAMRRLAARASRGLSRYAFGYDAVDDTKKRRRASRSVIWSEDDELSGTKRKKMQVSARDLQRNFSVAAWAIRKHLDYVATFSFQCRTGDADFNRRLETLFGWWARPENCDIAGRHSLSRFVRIAEQCRTLDGDVLVLLLSSGHLQAIESDRLQNPTGEAATTDLVQGVRVDGAGRALAYAVHDRVAGSSALTFDRFVDAQYAHLLGYYDRFDQVRGVSRMAPAINAYQDLYEGISYAIAKAKVGQLFGLVTYRDNSDPLGEYTQSADGSGYEIAFGAGPFHLDLNDGDKADILESKTPAVEFQQFVQAMIAMAIKSLDIPFSFYDESFTNYSGARQALLQYEQSVRAKREDLVELLDRITAWKIAQWVGTGLLTLPSGMRVTDLPWEWIPAGTPWIDPLKEANADALAIQTATRSRQQVCKARGADFFDVADQLAAEQEYLRALGLAAGNATTSGSDASRAASEDDDRADDAEDRRGSGSRDGSRERET